MATTNHQIMKTALTVLLFGLIITGMMWISPDSSFGGPLFRLQPKKGSVLIGAYDTKFVNGEYVFERVIGRRVAVINSFQAWSRKNRKRNYFDRDWVNFARTLHANNQVLMVTWEPWNVARSNDFNQPRFRLKTIIDGKHDRYMKRWFKQVRNLRQPIFVRFAHEMNGEWYPWGTHVNSRRDYIKAWRHVVNLSRKVGANNITWVWAPNVKMPRDHFKELFPGKKYVDWVGTSGYNWGGSGRDWTGWHSARKIFGPTLKILKKYKKPIMITEMGSRENPEPNHPTRRSKAWWIKQAYKYLKNPELRVRLVLYQNIRADRTYDWRVTTSRASKRDTKRVLSESIFQGMFKTRP